MAALTVERSYLTLPVLTIGIVSDPYKGVRAMAALTVEPMAALLVERATHPAGPHHRNSE